MPHFFPKTAKDYAQGQPRYTLLKKEKHNMITGETVIQYDRLTIVFLPAGDTHWQKNYTFILSRSDPQTVNPAVLP